MLTEDQISTIIHDKEINGRFYKFYSYKADKIDPLDERDIVSMTTVMKKIH